MQVSTETLFNMMPIVDENHSNENLLMISYSTGSVTQSFDFSGYGFDSEGEGVYSFAVKSNDAAGKVIKNIPLGYNYEIWEQQDQDYPLISIDNDSNKTSTIGTVTGDI